MSLIGTAGSSVASYRLIGEGGAALAEADYSADGTITVLDRDGRIVQQWTGDELRSIVQSHGAAMVEPVTLSPGMEAGSLDEKMGKYRSRRRNRCAGKKLWHGSVISL